MSNKMVESDYNRLMKNELAGDSLGIALRSVEDLSPRRVRSREGEMVNTKNKKIQTVYNQIIIFLIIFGAFSVYTLATGKIVSRTGSALLLVLALSGLVAFVNDKERWRKLSGK